MMQSDNSARGPFSPLERENAQTMIDAIRSFLAPKERIAFDAFLHGEKYNDDAMQRVKRKIEQKILSHMPMVISVNFVIDHAKEIAEMVKNAKR